MHRLTAWVPAGLPDIRPGMGLDILIVDLLRRNDLTPEDHDVLVVAQKVVSKAEGAVVHLAEIEPGAEAVALAADAQKDPRPRPFLSQIEELLHGQGLRIPEVCA